MSKILIFTNFNSAAQHEIGYKFGQIYPNRNSPIALFSFNGELELKGVSDLTQDDGVYLVFDGMGDGEYENKFKKIIEQCNKGDVALVHRFPKDIDGLRKKGVEIVKGMHEEVDGGYFFPIFDIIMDEKPDKEARIVKLLKPAESSSILEAAIKFFDGCLIPGNEAAIAPAYDVLIRVDSIKDKVNSFFEDEYKGKTSYQDYFANMRVAADFVFSEIIAMKKIEDAMKSD